MVSQGTLQERENWKQTQFSVHEIWGASRFIRTLKEQSLWVRVFQNVEELRCALAEFLGRYNQRWIVQRLGYLTPTQARQRLLALGAAA